jgi:hypothetical protein
VLAGVGDLVNLADDTVLVDDERHAGSEAALTEHAERSGDFLLGVGEEGEVEFFFLGELLLLGERIGADADDEGVGVFE